MTPRERVLKTLKHKQPDRIALDIGGTESSGLTAIAYNNLRNHLNLKKSKTQVFDVYQQVVKIEDDVRQLLEIDTVPLLIEPLEWKPFTLPDGSSCEIPEKWNPQKQTNGDFTVEDEKGSVIARMPAHGYYFEPIYAPLAGVSEPSQLTRHAQAIESFDWPFFADEPLTQIATRAKSLFENTDFAIVANLQLHLLAAGQILRGYENFMADLLINKKLAHAILERLTYAYIKRAKQYLEKVGRYVQVVLVNDDLGSQNAPLLSVDCYREMIFPYQERLFGFIKSKADVSLLMHSCGSVVDFIPFLIEAGVDALNPVQVSAAGMETKALKRKFGKDITFWGGGCDTQHILNRASADQIEQEVKRRIDDLAPGGGFVFTQVHNIQPDVPPANILAMVEAFKKYRDYCNIV